MRAARLGYLIGAFALLSPACAREQPRPNATPTCPATWTTPPALPSSLLPPDRSLRVVARVSASGTQDYECGSQSHGVDGGSAFAWTFVGPEATLTDCNAAPAGRHFASEAGATGPKWEARDGSFVVATKIAAEPSKDVGAVPWLLLKVTKRSDAAGTFSGVDYVQRTATAGGSAPASGCDASHTGAVAKVPYSADYWFLGR
ncbi:MAG: DUF3455 domain-containing protein [Polyangiaceae bacterium]|jgi:hypothetical protein